MSARIASHIYLPPALADHVRSRGEQLGIGGPGLIRVLLRNAVYAGIPAVDGMPADSSLAEVVREPFALSLPVQLKQDAEAFAAARGGTLSRLIEALLIADSADPARPLQIYPARRG